MSSLVRPIIRSVIRGAVGLRSPAEVEEVLEAHLFSEIVPASDAGEVASEAADVLIDLYQHLTENEHETARSLATTVHKLLRIPGIPEADPIGAVTFALYELVATGNVTGQDAEQSGSLPWRAAAKALTGVDANRLTSLAELLRCFAHEVEEGFVEATTEDAELYEKAKSLSHTLRSIIAGD